MIMSAQSEGGHRGQFDRGDMHECYFSKVFVGVNVGLTVSVLYNPAREKSMWTKPDTPVGAYAPSP